MSPHPTPVVDIITPVHTGQRPIQRALASVLDHTTTPVRIIVVCHNVAVDAIGTALGRLADDPRVELLSLVDHTRNIATPLNLGLDAAEAPFTALLDSDDTYEPGAIDGWLAVQRRDNADVVIPRMRHDDGRVIRSPSVRPGRSRRLNGVRDRLAYRTKQRGLVSHARFGHLRMLTGLPTGEDMLQGVSLWYSDARISFARRAPRYVLHADGGPRTTTTARPAAAELAFLPAVLDTAAALSPAQREAFAVKLLRIQLMDALRLTLANGAPLADLAALSEAVGLIDRLSPTARGLLSQRDARIAAELERGEANADFLTRELARRTVPTSPANLLPAGKRLLGREAPLRYLAATVLVP